MLRRRRRVWRECGAVAGKANVLGFTRLGIKRQVTSVKLARTEGQKHHSTSIEKGALLYIRFEHFRRHSKEILRNWTLKSWSVTRGYKKFSLVTEWFGFLLNQSDRSYHTYTCHWEKKPLILSLERERMMIKLLENQIDFECSDITHYLSNFLFVKIPHTWHSMKTLASHCMEPRNWVT